MSALRRHNVTEHGVPDATPMLFVHGFGCDQGMWRHVWPAFAEDHRVVLMDHAGAGSDPTRFDFERHASLRGYAQDVLDVLEALDLRDTVFVGHSVSAMVGALAAIEQPGRFRQLVMVGPSPRYLDDPADGYAGGFSQEDIDELLESLESNYLGWSSALAPVVMGADNGPELTAELEGSFCRMDPRIAARFARTTFLSDNRADLARVRTPTLVLQCARDVIAPEGVGAYVHAHVQDSRFVQLRATGHCPNLSAPEETTQAIREHLVG